MAVTYTAGDRVKISNEQNQYRGHLGEVTLDNGDGTYQVRIDGYPAGDSVLFDGGDIRSTTLPCPLTY